MRWRAFGCYIPRGRLKRSLSAVYGMAGKIGLSKSQEYLDGEYKDEARKRLARGEAYRFKTGQVPVCGQLFRAIWPK